MNLLKPSFYSPVAARWTGAFALSSLAWGIAFGIAANSKMSPGLATVMSGLVFSGTAQLLALELWRHPLPLLAMLMAALSVNARYLAMGATLADLYRGRTREGLVATALLSDASWVVGLRADREGHDPHAALLTANAMMWTAWVIGTLVGAIAGTIVPPSLLGALGYLVLALLAVLLPSLVAGVKNWVAPIVGAICALAADPWLTGSWHILVGGMAGAIVAYGMGQSDA